jgi:uncharacterized protein (DUF2249 family)/iron-sulfur cluster repair protein YtfE (RIC family)
MSHPNLTDQQAAQAVVSHHTDLANTLAIHADGLLDAAIAGDPTARQSQAALVAWLHAELLPHASAEEAALYPAAAGQPGGGALIAGMIDEHRAIVALVAELEHATSPVAAAAAARALRALFSTHLAKENDLVVPMLVAAPDVSLAQLLDGLHDLVGAEPASGSGCGGGGGGGCGCGGNAAGASGEAAVLTIDPRLDVRDLPHGQRHAHVLTALEALPGDGALVLIAPHAPLPLLDEIDARYDGQVRAEWLQDGPDVWQIRLRRVPMPT